MPPSITKDGGRRGGGVKSDLKKKRKKKEKTIKQTINNVYFISVLFVRNICVDNTLEVIWKRYILPNRVYGTKKIDRAA